VSTSGVLSDQALASNGTYRIVLEAADGLPPGAFSLLLFKDTVITTAITLGAATPGSLSAAGEVDEYTFAGTAGKTASVAFTTPTVSAKPDIVSRIQLISPSDAVVGNNPSCGTTNNLSNVALNETGTWKVRIKRFENFLQCGLGSDAALLTGSYTLTVTVSP